MTAPLNLDGPPICVECGAPMVVTEHEGEGDGGASLWSAACWAGLADDRHPEWVDLTERPTLRDQPGCAPLVAEIDRLRAEVGRIRTEYLHLDRQHRLIVDEFEAEIGSMRIERQAILDAGGDFLWAGGAKTLPEAVAGICHAYTVELDRRERERDQSPAAKVRDTFPHLAFTDADLVRLAVERAWRGEYQWQRWAGVVEIFARGSHVARELCRACGLDPNEMVGDDGDGEE